MSVQVRRRREAASFLSTYVGAQGELLVDTTNNRVQVHDGATPGGWPAAKLTDLANRNVLINGNFAINQRAYASGTALAAGAYAHDRWKAGSGGCTYTFTQAVPDTGVTITAGTLIQAIEASNVYANAFWLTWTGTATARAWQGSAAGAFSAGTAMVIGGVTVNALLVSGLTIGAVASIEFSTGTLGLVQLEAALPGAGPTRFERRQPGQEFFLCQRYFALVPTYAAIGQATTSSGILFTGLISVPMRATPSVTLLKTSVSASSYELLVGGAWVSGNLTASAPNITATAYNIYLSGITTTMTAGQLATWNANATISLFSMSAEL